MSSWLSDLERHRKEEEQEKYRQEKAQKERQEQEEAQALSLCERYGVHIDFIREQVKQLVARANAAGLTDLKIWQGNVKHVPVYILEINYGRKGADRFGGSSYNTDRSIQIYLEINGQIRLTYSWKKLYGKPGSYEWKSKYSHNRMPIQSATSSDIDAWVEWVATSKGFCPPSEDEQKGFLSRLLGR